MLIGTSNVEGINPKQLSSKYETRKVIAYKLDDTLKVLKERDFSPNPRVVVLHSLTNSIKDKPAEECVSKLDEIVQFIHNKWSHCKVVISLATVRSDKEEHNNNVHLVNALVRTKFLKRENVLLCDNDNLAFRGKPINRFMNSDGYHLSEQGVARLASNIKHGIEDSLGLKPPSKEGSRTNQSGYHPRHRGYNYNRQYYWDNSNNFGYWY